MPVAVLPCDMNHLRSFLLPQGRMIRASSAEQPAIGSSTYPVVNRCGNYFTNPPSCYQLRRRRKRRRERGSKTWWFPSPSLRGDIVRPESSFVERIGFPAAVRGIRPEEAAEPMKTLSMPAWTSAGAMWEDRLRISGGLQPGDLKNWIQRLTDMHGPGEEGSIIWNESPLAFDVRCEGARIW